MCWASKNLELVNRVELKLTLTDDICVLLIESGSAITASCIGLGNSTTPPPGQAGKPVPGYNGKTVLKMWPGKELLIFLSKCSLIVISCSKRKLQPYIGIFLLPAFLCVVECDCK